MRSCQRWVVANCRFGHLSPRNTEADQSCVNYDDHYADNDDCRHNEFTSSPLFRFAVVRFRFAQDRVVWGVRRHEIPFFKDSTDKRCECPGVPKRRRLSRLWLVNCIIYHGARHSSQIPQPSTSMVDAGRAFWQQGQVTVLGPGAHLRSGGRISILHSDRVSALDCFMTTLPSVIPLRWEALK